MNNQWHQSGINRGQPLRYFSFARCMLSGYSKIRFSLSDSWSSFLPKLSDDPSVPKQNVSFFISMPTGAMIFRCAMRCRLS